MACKETFIVRALTRLLNDEELFSKYAQRLFLERLTLTTDNIDILTVLSGCKNKEYGKNVRVCVAMNTLTPLEVLEYLSNDSDVNVRCYVAKNINTPIKVLEKLMKDPVWIVRSGVRFHPKLTREMRKYMGDHRLYLY